MSAIILGSDEFLAGIGNIPGLAERSRTRTKTAGVGYGWRIVYEGLPSSVNTAFQTLPDWCNAEVSEEGPTHRLVITYSDDPASVTATNAAFDSFEIPGNDLQTDILEHPKALNLGVETVTDILKFVNADELTTAEQTQVNALNGDAAELYDYLKRRNGSGGFQESQFVFRATKIVSRRAQFSVAYANLNKLYTFAQLKAEAGPTQPYINSLDAIAAQCVPDIIMDGFAWRWLKSAPTITTAPGNRFAIQVEWKLGVWNTWVYASA